PAKTRCAKLARLREGYRITAKCGSSPPRAGLRVGFQTDAIAVGFIAPPQALWQAAGEDYNELGGDEQEQREEDTFGKAISVQADAELVDAEEGPARDNVAADGEDGQAAVGDELIPFGVQNEGIPEHDDQSPVLLGVPAPEAAPRIIGPQPAEHRAHEAEENRKTHHAEKHA